MDFFKIMKYKYELSAFQNIEHYSISTWNDVIAMKKQASEVG